MAGLDESFDVIVVGGGGAGLACGVAAAEQGARVLLLEKQPRLGGSTGRAIGSFTASGTVLQRRAGIVDNSSDHDVDAGLFGPREYEARNNVPLRRHFFGQSGATLDWLVELGLAFHGPSPEPPNRVPRMHNVVPNAKAYVAILQARLVRLDGTIVVNAPVEQLIREDGRIVGVHAIVDGTPRDLRARCGVVLAAGDYTNSRTMIARYKGPGFEKIEGINPDALGGGHVLAESVGARLVNMDITLGPELRFVAPKGRSVEQLLPSKGPLMRLVGALMPLVPRVVITWLIKRLLVTWQHPDDQLLLDGAILVNSAGRRFCDETVTPAREIAVADQPGGIAYLLLDEGLVGRYSSWPHYISTAPDIAYAYLGDYLRLRPDIAVRGTSLDQVARSRALPAFELAATVAQCNATRTKGSTAVAPAAGPLTGPRWALLGPVRPYFTNSEGGVAINDAQQVLDQSGNVIAGLYAAGQTGLGGMVLWGHGLHIAWALTSGRLVGTALGRAAKGA